MGQLTINLNVDCGNSPKREFLKNFNIAFAQGDIDFILQHTSDDIVWEIFGDQKIKGKEAFTQIINEMAAYKAEELTIHKIITHGKEGALNGEIRMPDGKNYAFCDVYQFVSAGKNIIQKMSSYVIQNKS